MAPDVSIIVLTHNYPAVFSRLFDSLPQTTGVDYETVVVDNGSGPESLDRLREYEEAGVITTLVPEPINHFFSEGNNIGVRHSNPQAPYILLLNSDVEILRPVWLLRMVQWMEGVPETCRPYTFSDRPAKPTPGPRDIVSIGWSYTENVPGKARPEGWCVMIRREHWIDLSPDFPFYWGFEEAIAKAMHKGARPGVLSQYPLHVRHHEGGCKTWTRANQIVNRRKPDELGWFQGVQPPETLDFTLGPDEHRSYLQW